MLERFRRAYGAGPLHLLALVASFAIAGAAVAGWFQRQLDVGAVLIWFGGAIVAHDLVLLPLYSLLARIAFGRPPSARRSAGAVISVAYVRIPALISGLLLLAFLPLIFELSAGTYRAASGLGEGQYLSRWLAATGVLFALSGLACAIALRRARRRGAPENPSGTDPADAKPGSGHGA